MFIFKWLHSILAGARPELTQAGASLTEIQKKNKSDSIDLANATLVNQAKNLEELIAVGTPWIMRRKLKQRIRSKVKQVIADEYDDPEIIEEVTERITDVAEIDPYYKKLFSKDSE